MEKLEVPAELGGNVISPAVREAHHTDHMAGAKRAEELFLRCWNCGGLGILRASVVDNFGLARWEVRH